MKIVSIFMLLTSFVFSFKNDYFIDHKSNKFNLIMKKEKNKSVEYIYHPKGYNQKKYIEYLNDDRINIVAAVGPAGTGKTLFACLKAITLLKQGLLNKIVITRPMVSVEEELGFLPGDINDKMSPWTRPIIDIFSEYFSKTEIDNMIYNNIIEISPLAYMRGRTFKNSFIIADEMQNSSPNQMMMLTTRIGVNSKMVITGDLKQTDRQTNNGLSDFIEKINTYKQYNSNQHDSNEYIKILEFNKNDVERSEIVEKLIDIYSFKKIENNTIVNSIVFNNSTISKVESEKIIINNFDNDAALIPKRYEPITNIKFWRD